MMEDYIVLQMAFQRVVNEKNKEIGIDGVKKLIIENQNSSLKKRTQNDH